MTAIPSNAATVVLPIGTGFILLVLRPPHPIRTGDVMAEPRPKFSPEIARLAAAEVVGELIEARHIEEAQRGDATDDLAKHVGGPYSDGYAIAKRLDYYAGWDCNFEMAEILNGLSSTIGYHIRQAEELWAARTSPQPPYPIGTRVKLDRDQFGTIDGISKYGTAQYEVKVDGDHAAKPPTNSRRIINFEDAKPEAEAA
jgi:hypothetical protein